MKILVGFGKLVDEVNTLSCSSEAQAAISNMHAYYSPIATAEPVKIYIKFVAVIPRSANVVIWLLAPISEFIFENNCIWLQYQNKLKRLKYFIELFMN